MDICASRRSFDLRLISHKFLIRGQFKLHVLWLRRAAICAGLFMTFIARIAVWAGPFVFDISKTSSA
jgi:hypothetical protein